MTGSFVPWWHIAALSSIGARLASRASKPGSLARLRRACALLLRLPLHWYVNILLNPCIRARGNDEGAPRGEIIVLFRTSGLLLERWCQGHRVTELFEFRHEVAGL
jgi:hypothetical protein